jgi:hypothetical protein
MNAALNGDRIVTRSGIAGHVRPHIIWWLPVAFLLFVSACVTPEKPRPTVTIAPATQIAVQLPGGQPGPMAKLLADSVVEALIQRGFPARIADGRAALFVISGTIESLDERYAPMVAALHWTLNDGKGSKIAYLNQRVRGQRDAWAYGSPAMLQTIGQETAADLSPFLGEPTIIVPRTRPAPEIVATPTVTSAAAGDDTEQLAHSSGLLPIVANQSTPAPPPPALPPPPVSGENRGFVDFGIWVDDVTGAPGDGNQSLTGALLAELRRAALPFALSAGTASHFVQGVVDVSVTDATTEHVTILWAVSDENGKELGRITQRNNIVRGSLHQAWGKTAQYAAIGGAEAVLAIIERDLTTE